MAFPLNFVFATGIENSYPVITGKDGKDKRIDEMEICGHYKNWKTDFHLALDIGVSHLRYGPPYYKTHLGPGIYDWSFTDETFGYLRETGLTPITDLCHFGVPDWIGNFQNPDFPKYFAEYAQAFAKRYPWVRWYTPINEIFIAATFSAQYGWWNERLTGDRHFIIALTNLCKANTLAMRSILEVQPNSVFVQSESSEYFHPHAPGCMARANLLNEKRFLALDLTYGHNIDARMFEYLIDNGMTRNEYHWFLENHVKGFCIMGTDYYSSNEHMVFHDGSFKNTGEIFGYYVITKQYYDRYTIPVMHTETNCLERNDCVSWLQKEWANLFRLRRDGIPIVGFTWYSLTHQVDWDSALRFDNGTINTCGLFDLDRKIEPVGIEYRSLIKNWLNILPTGSKGLQLGC
ncbi:MAG: family 1 glycosylhydrolase [Bacteriovoracaceae bacterium]